MRRATFTNQPVTYGAVGGTQAPDLLYYPPKGYRPMQKQMRLGSGDERFDTAVSALMTWGVQRGSGILVTEVTEGTGVQYEGIEYDSDGTPTGMRGRRDEENVVADDGVPFIRNGMTAVLQLPFGPFTTAAPIRVVYIVDEPSLKGFAYGTLHGHPASGEEAFLVEQREDGTVWLVVRSFSRPASGFYRLMPPVLRAVQARMTARYLRALLPARSA